MRLQLSGQSQLRLIKKVTRCKPFMKISILESILDKANKAKLNRVAEQTTLKIEAELRRIEIDKCLEILKDN